MPCLPLSFTVVSACSQTHSLADTYTHTQQTSTDKQVQTSTKPRFHVNSVHNCCSLCTPMCKPIVDDHHCSHRTPLFPIPALAWSMAWRVAYGKSTDCKGLHFNTGLLAEWVGTKQSRGDALCLEHGVPLGRPEKDTNNLLQRRLALGRASNLL